MNKAKQVQTSSNRDMVIIGGGVVGGLLAQAITQLQLPITVTLISAHQLSTSTGYQDDIRALALAQQTLEQIAKMGIDTDFVKCAIQQIHISDQGQIGQVRLTAAENAVPALGHVTAISVLEQAINHALLTHTHSTTLADTGKLQVLEQTQCREVQTQPDGTHRCVLDNGQVMTSTCVVFADGQVAGLKQQLGMTSTVKDYGQQGVVSVVGIDRPGPARYQDVCTAFERFTSNGPLALLPMHTDANESHITQRYSLVWCTSEPHSAQILHLTDNEFLNTLQQCFGDRAGRFVQVAERQRFNLQLTTHRTTTAGIFCIGNAAQALHPIAGQGFNLAVRDISDFVDSIKTAHAHQHLGSAAHSADFSTRRESDRNTIIQATDSLLHIFSNDYIGLKTARAKGLSALHLLKPLKLKFAKMAMGYR